MVGSLALVSSLGTVARAQPPTTGNQPAQDDSPAPQSTSNPDIVFDMGKIEVVGSVEGRPGVGGALLTSEQIWTIDRKSLDQAVNIVPGVANRVFAAGAPAEVLLYTLAPDKLVGRNRVPEGEGSNSFHRRSGIRCSSVSCRSSTTPRRMPSWWR
jgi:hypothetical protein